MSHHEDGEVPQEVLDFLKELSGAVNSGDIQSAHSLYEARFPHLTAQYFSRYSQKHVPFHPWPQLTQVQRKLDGEGMKALYRFIQYRSMFMDRQVKGDTAKNSWEAFNNLFDMLINGKFVDLPAGWLWDMFDEFAFQLQTVHIRAIKLGKDYHAWNVTDTIALLEKVVKVTGFVDTLGKVERGELSAEAFHVPGNTHIRHCAGLFAYITLMRVDLLLGDYNGVITRCGALAVHKNCSQLTTRVPASHVSLFYTTGFAYMMRRRYADASMMFRTGLNVKAVHRSFVDTLQGHIVMLMAATNVLGNMPMEDFSSFLNENNKGVLEEDILLLSQGDTERFREVFLRASPKFLAIRGPSGSEYSTLEARELQLRVFMREVSQQIDCIKLRGYFRVYSAMTCEKAGTLLHPEAAKEASISSLLSVKHKSRQMVYPGSGPACNGEFASKATTDFTVSEGSVSVVNRAENSKLPITNDLLKRVENLNKRLEL